MKKNLLTIAIATALTIATAMPAFAAFIVAPPNDDVYSTEYLQWEWAEAKRWEDRLISEHADRIKAIENPVDRINEVVKAVASYSEYNLIDAPSASRVMRWEAGSLDSDMLADLCISLGKEVGLDIQKVGNMYHTQLASTTYCLVDGTDYWFDTYAYDIAKDSKYLAHAGQPEWVMTQEQLNDSYVEAEPVMKEVGDTFTLEDGRVITLVP